MSLHLERASTAPCLHVSTSLHLQRASRPPCLRTSMSLHLHRASRSPCLQYLRVSTPTTCFQSSILHASMSLHLQRASISLDSIPPCRYICDAPLELRTSISLH